MFRSLALVLVLALAGCGAPVNESKVVAGFYPLQFITETLLDEPVTNLTKPGIEPHDIDLSVQSTAALTSAELVVRLAGFQPGVDKVVAGSKSDLDVSSAADLESRDGAADPHFWQDPVRVASVARVVADRLESLHPDQASEIDQRLDTLVGKLEQLDASYRSELTNCETKVVVVNHEAFGYLAKYGLKIISYAGLSPDAEPSAAHIAKMQRLIRDEKVSTVYGEVLVENRGLDAIAKDLALDIVTLDPVEGPHEHGAEDGGSDTSGDYFDLMEHNLEILQKGNQCRS